MAASRCSTRVRHFLNCITVRGVRRLAREVKHAKLVPCSPIANQRAFHRRFQHASRADVPKDALGRDVKRVHRFLARLLAFRARAVGVGCGLSELQQLR